VEGPKEGLARLYVSAFANNATLGPITFREMKELVLRETKRKHVTARSDYNALHKTELAVEGDTLRRRQRHAILVEHRNRLAPVTAKPGIVLAIDCIPKCATLHAATGKAGRQR